MRKALVTFGVGRLASVLDLTRPAMQEYAERLEPYLHLL